MRKKSYFLIILLLVGIFSVFYLEKNTASIQKIEYLEGDSNLIGTYDVELGIDKRDENRDYLSGVEFKLSTYNEVESFDSAVDTNGYFVDDRKSDSLTKVKRVLSTEQTALVNSIRTTQDLNNINNGAYVSCKYEVPPLESVNPVEGGLREDGISGNYICSIPLPTVFYLEETRVPTGYVKDKQLVPGVIILRYLVENYTAAVEVLSMYSPQFRFDSDQTYNVTLQSMYVANIAPIYTMEYGKTSIESLVGTNIDTAWELWDNLADVGRSCSTGTNGNEMALFYTMFTGEISNQPGEAFLEGNSASGDAAMCGYAYLVNQKGNVSLEVKNYVNNTASVTTNVNQTLQYKVVVKNTGDIDAIENVVRATLPSEFTFLAGTASDRGVYNNGVVEWQVDRINAGEEITLTFNAYAPNGVKSGQDYVGTANVSTFALDTPVDSNRTMVRLTLSNPKTYVPLEIILVVLMISFWTIYYVFIQHLMQQKQSQKQTQE